VHWTTGVLGGWTCGVLWLALVVTGWTATVQLWVVPHAGHTHGLATAPGAWEARVISFLNAALKPYP
jgi:hypothetical protein